MLSEIRNPNKIWHYLSNDNFLDENRFIHPPISIEIQPTSACNLRCKWCSYWKRNNFDLHKSNYMKQEVIEKLLEYCEIKKVKSIYVAGGGEPCVYPYIEEMITRIYKSGISCAMITNGNLFAKKLLIKANYFKYIQVSIIGIDPESYLDSTGSNRWFDEMRKFPLKIKQQHGLSSPLIGGMYVLTEWNYRDAFNVIEFCKENQFDYCSFRKAVDFEKRGVALSKNVIDFLKNEAQRHPRLDNHYTNLMNILNGIQQDYIPSQCLNIKLGLYAIVDTNANVYLCIPDVGNTQYCLGSLNENTFDELWNSSRHHEIVALLNTRYQNIQCHGDCRAHGYNKAALQQPTHLPLLHSEFL